MLWHSAKECAHANDVCKWYYGSMQRLVNVDGAAAVCKGWCIAKECANVNDVCKWYYGSMQRLVHVDGTAAVCKGWCISTPPVHNY